MNTGKLVQLQWVKWTDLQYEATLRKRLSWCGEVTGGRKHYTVDYLGVGKYQEAENIIQYTILVWGSNRRPKTLHSRLSWCGEVTGGRKHYTVDYLGVGK